MTDDVKNFRADYLDQIIAGSVTNVEDPEIYFMEDISDILIDDQGNVSEIDKEVFIDYVSNTPKYKSMHVDGAHLENLVLTLLYCDYNPGEVTTINNEYIRNKVSLLEGFVYNALRGYFTNAMPSERSTQLANEIIGNQDKINRLQLIIISTNESSQRLNKHWDIPDFEVGNKVFKVDLLILDIQAIYEAKFSGNSREKIHINTKDFGLEKGIPCVKAEIESKDYDAYLAVVPGQFLADIYLKYNARILENNVRSFLNIRKNGINEGILTTIQTDKSRFFAYNNGIATTADNIKIESRPDGSYITEFDNFQIINGGQTTATIATAATKGEDLSGIYVQMKLSKIKDVGDKHDDELVQNITTYANKQNKVTDSDFSSSHAYFVRIESYSRTIKTPRFYNTTVQTIWYFERIRGQYDRERLQKKSHAEQKAFDLAQPRNQKFTKSDLAKFLNSANTKPYLVSLGAEGNLKDFYQNEIKPQWKKDNTIYNEKYYQDLIAKAIVFKAIDNIVVNEDWYQANKGYKANIVPYTFSKFVYEVGKIDGRILDYGTIWNTQQIIPEYISDLKKIAKIVYDVLNDPHREYFNISEYAKREVCWKKVMNHSCTISDETIAHTIRKQDAEDIDRAARKDQKVTNGAASTIDIYNAGVSYWQSVLSLDERIGVLNQTQKELCQYAIDYINGRRSSMTDRQAKSLGEVIDIMKEYNLSTNME